MACGLVCCLASYMDFFLFFFPNCSMENCYVYVVSMYLLEVQHIRGLEIAVFRTVAYLMPES